METFAEETPSKIYKRLPLISVTEGTIPKSLRTSDNYVTKIESFYPEDKRLNARYFALSLEHNEPKLYYLLPTLDLDERDNTIYKIKNIPIFQVGSNYLFNYPGSYDIFQLHFKSQFDWQISPANISLPKPIQMPIEF